MNNVIELNQKRRGSVLCAEKREPTGLKDIEGTDIHTGDIVEFYFDEFGGYSSDKKSGFTRMRDVVKKVDGTIYFILFARRVGALPGEL